MRKGGGEGGGREEGRRRGEERGRWEKRGRGVREGGERGFAVEVVVGRRRLEKDDGKNFFSLPSPGLLAVSPRTCNDDYSDASQSRRVDAACCEGKRTQAKEREKERKKRGKTRKSKFGQRRSFFFSLPSSIENLKRRSKST